MGGRRLLPVVVLLATLAAPPVTTAAAPAVSVDNAQGNVIATGVVVHGREDPANALVTVTNGYHFWAAIDRQPPIGGAALRPASLLENLGGIYAAGGLIAPSATAAYDGTFDPTTGGSQAVRVHNDVTSAGGAAALAGNLLTIIADGLGASLSAASPTELTTALKLVSDLPDYAAFVQAMKGTPNLFDIIPTIQTLLDSPVGRATIRQALANLHVTASDADLVKVGSVIGIIDGGQLVVDLLSASIWEHTDGTVTFSAPGSAPTATWVAPKQGATIKTTKLTLSATPTNGTQPAKVVYSIAWGSKAPKTACTATTAASDGSWPCTVDLAKIGAPTGMLIIGFDVYDDAGDLNRAPDGTRQVTYAPSPPAVPTGVTSREEVFYDTCRGTKSPSGRCDRYMVNWHRASGSTTSIRVYGSDRLEIVYGPDGPSGPIDPLASCDLTSERLVAIVDSKVSQTQVEWPSVVFGTCWRVAATNSAGESRRVLATPVP